MPSEPKNQREYNRYPPTNWGKDAQVKKDGKKQEIEIVDESLGGLGVRSKDDFPDDGEKIKIENDSFARNAKVVYKRKDEQGETHAGVEWLPNSEYESPTPSQE